MESNLVIRRVYEARNYQVYLESISLRKFTKEEVLKIIVDFACESLPANLNGIVEAEINKNNEIKVYFIASLNDSEIS